MSKRRKKHKPNNRYPKKPSPEAVWVKERWHYRKGDNWYCPYTAAECTPMLRNQIQNWVVDIKDRLPQEALTAMRRDGQVVYLIEYLNDKSLRRAMQAIIKNHKTRRNPHYRVYPPPIDLLKKTK